MAWRVLRPGARHAQLTRAVVPAPAAAAAAILQLQRREAQSERLVVKLLQVQVVALLQETDPLGALLLELLALLHHLPQERRRVSLLRIIILTYYSLTMEL